MKIDVILNVVKDLCKVFFEMFTICDFSYARLKSSNKFGFNSLN